MSGIATGYDTAQLIEQLIAVERRPVIALQQKQAKIKTKTDAWKDISSRLSNLRSRAAALKSPSIYNARSVSSSSDKALAATAGTQASPGTYKVWVDRLATSTVVTGASRLGRDVDLNVKLSDAGFATTPTAGTFTINGVQVRIDADTVLSDGVDDASSSSVIGKINNSDAGVTASVLNNKLVIVSKTEDPVRLGSGGDTSNFLTAARLLGVESGTSVTSQGIIGVVKSTTVLDKARLASTLNHSVTGGVVEGAEQGKLKTALGVGESVTFSYHGIEYTAQLAGGDDMAAIASDLEEKMNAAAGLDLGTIRVRTSGLDAPGNDRFVVTDTATPAGAVEQSFTFSAAPAALGLTDADGASRKGLIKINGVAIEFDRSTHAVQDIINRINASSANVSASYDALEDRMNVAAKYTGGLEVSFEDIGGNFLELAGLVDAQQDHGQNALFRIEGINGGEQLSSASNTVSDILSGVTLNFKEQSTDPVTVIVTHNIDSAMGTVRAFVDQYNSLLDLMATQTAYNKESETAGVMQGNSTVRNIQQNLRKMTMDPSLLAIGISTGAPGKGDGKSAQLKIDEEMLRKAIAENPEAVSELFGDEAAGFSVKLESYIDDLIKGTNAVIPKTQELMNDQTKQISDRIADIERRLDKRKESLVRQFTQMEKALASMQQQSAWMNAQFSSLGLGV